MKVRYVIDFLQKVLEIEGDIEVQSITGFWVRDDPSTGKRIVICSVGDGQSIEDLIDNNRKV